MEGGLFRGGADAVPEVFSFALIRDSEDPSGTIGVFIPAANGNLVLTGFTTPGAPGTKQERTFARTTLST